MSSPLAKRDKRIIDEALIALHRRISHLNRVNKLSSLFIEILKTINREKKILRILDVGCGDMMISKTMSENYDEIKIICIDIYPNRECWDNYFEFDGKNIPFADKSFDVVLFSDVLHHDYYNIKTLLIEAKRVANFIIVKDHFEYGLLSRITLQLADFIGNYGYGVSIPSIYLSKDSYAGLLEGCKIREIEQRCPIQLYNNLIVKLLFRSKYQFISLLV
jgi:SAM-dependent methyltransferase